MAWKEIDYALSSALRSWESSRGYTDTWVEPDDSVNLVVVCDSFGSRYYVRSLQGDLDSIPKPKYFRALYFHTVQLP